MGVDEEEKRISPYKKTQQQQQKNIKKLEDFAE